MSFGKTLTLSNGATIPRVGFGTWQADPGEVGKAVIAAVKAGYRHLDFAMIYENQVEIGEALKEVIPSVVKREELFITSKLWNSAHQPAEIEKELDETLKQLGLDYLDLYLMHWPVGFPPGNGLNPPDNTKPGYMALDTETPISETWIGLTKLPKSKVRAVGVSNLTIANIEGVIKASGVIPVANQVEAHPLLPQDDLVAYCKEKNIHITAYSSFGNNSIGYPLLIHNDTVKAVAEKLGATPAQVLVAWCTKRGYSVIPKSVKEARIIENFKEVELSDEDYEKVSSIGHNNRIRFNIPFRYKPLMWDISIFEEPEESTATHHVKV